MTVLQCDIKLRNINMLSHCKSVLSRSYVTFLISARLCSEDNPPEFNQGGWGFFFLSLPSLAAVEHVAAGSNFYEWDCDCACLETASKSGVVGYQGGEGVQKADRPAVFLVRMAQSLEETFPLFVLHLVRERLQHLVSLRREFAVPLNTCLYHRLNTLFWIGLGSRVALHKDLAVL